MTSGLCQLYPGAKARPSSGWGSFVLSVLQMAVPTGGSLSARPPRCPPDHRHSRPPGGRLFFLRGRPPTDRMPDEGDCSYGRRPRKNNRPPRLSAPGVPFAVRQPFAWRTAAFISPAVHWSSAGPTARRTASSVSRPSARPSTARTASCLIPAPGNPLPPPRRSPPPTVLSTVEFQVSINRAAQTPSVCF